jgi:exodeoxyribonuclease III
VLTIATWNLNSIKARLDRLLGWLGRQQPDVVCLQELKVREEDFPFAELRAAGYHAAVLGQKTYNGVAILSREEPERIERGMDDGVDDPQARLIAARVWGIDVVSVYVPNGAELGSDKCAYKLEWTRRLRAWLERHHVASDRLALCGDFNVAPEARDVAEPSAWEDSVLFHPEMRAALEHILGFGLVDTFRLHHEEPGLYSWWDYRMLAFPRNQGLRIDHIFATRPLAERCVDARIDRQERKGKLPSDHAPVMAAFDV